MTKNHTHRRENGEHPTSNNTQVHVLGVDLSSQSAETQFTILSIGVFIFFLTCAWIEELVFKSYGFEYAWYLTAIELFEIAGFGFLEKSFLPEEQKKKSTKENRAHQFSFALLAVGRVVSRGCSNWSLQFLNFPTQVIFKSLKLIAIMIVGVFMLNHRYSLKDYCAALLLVSSAVLFSLGDMEVSLASFSAFGVALVMINLGSDAITTNYNEKLLRLEGVCLQDVLGYSNLYASVLVFGIVFFSGEFMPAFTYCNEYPELYVYFTIRTALGYSGAVCYIALIKCFGSHVAASVTTVRKICTIVLSFLVFPKPFTNTYLIAGVFFVAGVALNINRSDSRRSHNSSKKRR